MTLCTGLVIVSGLGTMSLVQPIRELINKIRAKWVKDFIMVVVLALVKWGCNGFTLIAGKSMCVVLLICYQRIN